MDRAQRGQLKKLTAIAEVAGLLNKSLPAEQTCDAVCRIVVQALRFPHRAVARTQIGAISRVSPGFQQSAWGLKRSFRVSSDESGSLEVYYVEEMRWPGGLPFTTEEEELLESLASLLSGAATKAAYEQLLHDNTEREKELGGISRIVSILQKQAPLEELLQEICNALPDAWEHPERAEARIIYGDHEVTTAGFVETPWIQSQGFVVPQGPQGRIEIAYREELPVRDEGPFLKEERTLLVNIAQLLAVAAGSRLYESLVARNRERLKELNVINQTSRLITLGKSIGETLSTICSWLPDSWQYPEDAAARIVFGSYCAVSKSFEETPWVIRENFITIDNQSGSIEVFYLKEYPAEDEGPFLKEERDCIGNIARLVAHFLNNYKGRELFEQSRKFAALSAPSNDDGTLPETSAADILENTLLFATRKNTLRYTVKRILIISSPYDAYTLQSMTRTLGPWSDPLRIDNLVSMPHQDFAISFNQAVQLLNKNRYEFVVLVVRSEMSIETEKELRNLYPTVPMYLLVQSPALARELTKEVCPQRKVFLWTHDPLFLFSLVHLHEDRINAGDVDAPTLLIVDDSPEFYTPVISLAYRLIFEDRFLSRHHFLTGVNNFETRMRVVFSHNYEDAIHYSALHAETLKCLVSDIQFDRIGTVQQDSGLNLVRAVQSHNRNVRCILYSTDTGAASETKTLGACFVDKNNSRWLHNLELLLKSIVPSSFDNGAGTTQVDTLQDLIVYIKNSTPERLMVHLKAEEFASWFRYRGLVQLSTQLTSAALADLGAESIGSVLIDRIRRFTTSHFRGETVAFDTANIFTDSYVNQISGGQVGGKGRGVAFLNALTGKLQQFDLPPQLSVRTPVTALVGTDEFERVRDLAGLSPEQLVTTEYEELRGMFCKVPLSTSLRERLGKFLDQIRTPIAVRSSSLLEDSIAQPMAGIFETYILPNNDPDPAVRLEQLELALKLVYASLYRPEARAGFELLKRNIHDEKMAAVVQQLVGDQFDDYFYPHISGVAGSYNFYPVSHMKPEEGFAVIAFGLGVYVVEGRSGHRFSPAYPGVDFGSTKDLLHGSQVKFYAVDMKQSAIDFLKTGEKGALSLLDIDIAEKNGSLLHCASVYDPVNDRIVSDMRVPGPRIVDFGDILRHEYLPVGETIDKILRILSAAMGSPVEIEFAIDIRRKTEKQPSLYLLQVKPLLGEQLGYNLDEVTVDPESVILYSGTSLGNGRIDTLTDIVVFHPEAFDRLKTEDMAAEVEYFNKKMVREEREYLLIGPGRWGTRDKSLGIPVAWGQISKARVIVEVGLTTFPLDASLGSHFFHNLTAMNVGYLAVNESRQNDIIRWNALRSLSRIESRRYFSHVRSDRPLTILMDGKKRKALIIRS